MAIIIGGHETGLLDTSSTLLGRDDRTSNSDPGSGEQIHVNVSNGNLLLTQQDTFLPSRGDDFQLIRTYNSRGVPSDASQHDDGRWSTTSTVRLYERNSGGEKHFEVLYGDGTFFEYRLDERVPSLLVDLAVIRRGVRPLHNLAVLGTWRNRLFANWENFFQIGFHFVKIIKVA